MKKYIMAFALLAALLSGKAWGQADSLLRLGFDNSFLYERYAGRTDLVVAQLVHFPVDSNVFTNGLMIQAEQDSVWSSLLDEFSLPKEELTQKSKTKVVGAVSFRDRIDPTQPAAMVDDEVSVMGSCILVVSCNHRSLWIFHYASDQEATMIYKKLYKKLISL